MLACSRKEAEQTIEGGWVRVDGQRIELPQARVGEQQVVEVDPQARLTPLLPVTLLLHKPPGYDWDAVAPKPAQTPSLMRRIPSSMRERSSPRKLRIVPLSVTFSGITL